MRKKRRESAHINLNKLFKDIRVEGQKVQGREDMMKIGTEDMILIEEEEAGQDRDQEADKKERKRIDKGRDRDRDKGAGVEATKMKKERKSTKEGDQKKERFENMKENTKVIPQVK